MILKVKTSNHQEALPESSIWLVKNQSIARLNLTTFYRTNLECRISKIIIPFPLTSAILSLIQARKTLLLKDWIAKIHFSINLLLEGTQTLTYLLIRTSTPFKTYLPYFHQARHRSVSLMILKSSIIRWLQRNLRDS